MKKKVIVDFDNTIGKYGCDLDDALAFLYLYLHPNIEITAVLLSYGNSNIQDVHRSTKYLFKSLNITDIPYYIGCSNRLDRNSEAVDYLNKINFSDLEIYYLCLGSTSTLYQFLIDKPSPFAEVIFMGGITDKLLINGEEMKELNFSIDHFASYNLMKEKFRKTVITGNLCLPVFYTEEMIAKFSKYPFIITDMKKWAKYLANKYNIYGFHIWDLIAAVYITNPELFKPNKIMFKSDLEALQCGKIDYISMQSSEFNLPLNFDVVEFNKIVKKIILN